MSKPWIEHYIDHMGLVVALSGVERFAEMKRLKDRIALLEVSKASEVREAIRLRFTPTNGQDGCQSGTAAVRDVAQS